MSAHTPGPWEALPIRDDARGFRVREVRHRSDTATGGVHVEVHELGATGGIARLDADAHLVAAAPDLLAALEAVLASGLNGGNDVRLALIALSGMALGPAGPPDLEQAERSEVAVELARAAIAKARGGK